MSTQDAQMILSLLAAVLTALVGWMARTYHTTGAAQATAAMAQAAQARAQAGQATTATEATRTRQIEALASTLVSAAGQWITDNTTRYTWVEGLLLKEYPDLSGPTTKALIEAAVANWKMMQPQILTALSTVATAPALTPEPLAIAAPASEA